MRVSPDTNTLISASYVQSMASIVNRYGILHAYCIRPIPLFVVLGFFVTCVTFFNCVGFGVIIGLFVASLFLSLLLPGCDLAFFV